MIIGKSLTAIVSGGLKPEIHVTAKAGALLNLRLKNSSIILQSYQLGVSETQHTFIVNMSDTAYIIEDVTNGISVEALMNTVSLFNAQIQYAYITVTAKASALLNLHLKNSSIILQTYQLSASETTHTFIVDTNSTAYVIDDATNGKSAEILVSSFTQYNVQITYFLPPSSTTVGNVITWDNKTWRIVHYDTSSKLLYLLLEGAYSKPQGWQSHGSQTPIYYLYSNAYKEAMKFQDELSSDALAMIVPTTIDNSAGGYNGDVSSSKAFVPSVTHIYTFSYFKNNPSARILYVNGQASDWWTSTVSDYWEGDVDCVTTTGSITSNYGISGYSAYIRPCVAVQM